MILIYVLEGGRIWAGQFIPLSRVSGGVSPARSLRTGREPPAHPAPSIRLLA